MQFWRCSTVVIPLYCALVLMTVACAGEYNEQSTAADTLRLDAGTDDSTGNSPDNRSTIDDRRAQFLQIRDEPTALLELVCEGDLFPGADIDSVVLYSNPSLSAVRSYLEDCSWGPKGDFCPTNSGSGRKGAEGKKDGNAFQGFTSLNGGVLVCKWSDDVFLELGNIIRIIEVGPADQLEQFQVRACKDQAGDNCGEWQTGTASQLTFPAGTILP
ncbi:MAG: hypothetical protein VX223_06510 [Myxococcota bacterium]|nr:hypothetical protein [Myxococcota bacterium]